MNGVEALRSVVRAADARVASVLAPHALGIAEWRLLAALATEGVVAPSVLAERFGITRGGMTKVIDRLRARRLVVRAGAGGADRRYQSIALTGSGAVLVRALTVAAAAASALTEQERRALTRVVEDDAG